MDNSAPADRPTPTLVAEGVSFGYGPLKIVNGASLQVGQGEIVVLIGPNGAGKSTLVKGINGQLPLIDVVARRTDTRSSTQIGPTNFFIFSDLLVGAVRDHRTGRH